MEFTTDAKGAQALKLLHSQPRATITDRRVRLELKQIEVSHFLQVLAEQKIRFTDLEIRKPDLESYFLKLAGGGKS
jgi:hypothetical protein